MEANVEAGALKRVLVTGGGTGIGLATVAELLKRKIGVCAIGRRADVLSAARDLGADIYPFDVRSDSTALFEKVGPVDGLVLSAGIQCREALGDWTVEGWSSLLQTNLIASAMLTQAFVGQLSGPGSVVGVASTLSRMPAPATAAYAASKAGLVALLRTVALERAAQGVRANVVLPGLVDTPMLVDGSDTPAAANPDWIRLHPLGRIGRPGEIATVIVDVLLREWMTGAEIVIDGGQLLGTAEK